MGFGYFSARPAVVGQAPLSAIVIRLTEAGSRGRIAGNSDVATIAQAVLAQCERKDVGRR